MRTSLFLAGFAAFLLAAACAPEEGKEVEAILNRQTIRFSQPPSRIPSQVSVDAPLMGNGSTGVALAGTPDHLVFYLALLFSSFVKSY